MKKASCDPNVKKFHGANQGSLTQTTSQDTASYEDEVKKKVVNPAKNEVKCFLVR